MGEIKCYQYGPYMQAMRDLDTITVEQPFKGNCVCGEETLFRIRMIVKFTDVDYESGEVTYTVDWENIPGWES